MAVLVLLSGSSSAQEKKSKLQGIYPGTRVSMNGRIILTSVKKSKFQEVYTGTMVNMNGRMVSTGFNLSIRDFTNDEQAQRYLGILGEGDQEDLLKVIRDLDLGRLSTTGHVGRNLIVVRKRPLSDGRTRIVAVFERWQTFREVRGGYRVSDYPFGLMEIILDGKGKGGGTFIAACKIDLKKDKKTGKYELELENFGTYPHKVMGVMRRD
jgi:hypothetical protein